MIDSAWRTVVIENPVRIRTHDGQLIVETPNTAVEASNVVSVPVSEIRHLIVCSVGATVSIETLNVLAENNAIVVFCDKKYNPSSISVPIGNNGNAAGVVMKQACWDEDSKDKVWQIIAKQKINNQAMLLRNLGIDEWKTVKRYSENASIDSSSTAESTAAKVYFRALFGKSFIRHTENEINSALDYGYVVVCTAISRLLVKHGYSTSLGIHHISKGNRFNLSCDIMEPFRPFIDKVVYDNRKGQFDWEYKKRLLETLNDKVIYKNKKYSFCDAVEAFLLDVLGVMNGENREIGEVRFCLEEKVS